MIKVATEITSLTYNSLSLSISLSVCVCVYERADLYSGRPGSIVGIAQSCNSNLKTIWYVYLAYVKYVKVSRAKTAPPPIANTHTHK